MDFSAENVSLWQFIITFGILSGMVFLANVLRRKVKFVQKSLMPVSVLAGFLLLILRQTGILTVNIELMEMITYHTIALGFIALALRVPHSAIEGKKNYGAVKSGALIVSTYLVQGSLGLIITLALSYTVMPGLYKAAGILLPMGYGQGPGQANNIGTLYEQNGFVGGQSFGLALAAAGFLVACIVGVVYLNILRKQGKITAAAGYAGTAEMRADEFQDKNEIPIAESMDRFTVQLAFVFFIYLIAYLFTKWLVILLQNVAPGLAGTVSSLLWGFNFITGSLFAMLCRFILKKFKKANLMTRQYQNNYLLNRISGALFDYMIICGIASINLYDLAGLWVPFIILAAAGGVGTLVYLNWICKKLFPDFRYEAFFSMFGMLTGTISSGVLLLRELDPMFATPAANNLVTGSSVAILFGAPVLVLTAIAYRSAAMTWLTLGLCVAYMSILVLFLLRFNKKRKDA